MAACVLDPKEIGTPLSDDQVSNVTNIFFFVTGGEVQNELSVFVIGKVFQPYLIFVEKTRSLPKRVTPKRPFSRRLWPYLHILNSLDSLCVDEDTSLFCFFVMWEMLYLSSKL